MGIESESRTTNPKFQKVNFFIVTKAFIIFVRVRIVPLSGMNTLNCPVVPESSLIQLESSLIQLKSSLIVNI